MKTETAAKQLEALGNPTRLALYRCLIQAGRRGLPVGEVQSELQIPASTLSHHISKLVQAGLIEQRRESRTLFCTANYAAMDALLGFMVDKCCAKEHCRD